MEVEQDLFDTQTGGLQTDIHKGASGDSRIELAAHRLAVDFTEDANLPTRFRKTSSTKSKKIKRNAVGPKTPKKDSKVEQRFRTNVGLWRQLIETMIGKIGAEQTWRFVDLSPKVDSTVHILTDCRDFCDFMDYLMLRRDKEDCSDDELGSLTMLSVAFQREIERRIQPLRSDKVSK